ncbi:MAG: pilus assembly protein TadG-related protein [Actinomycetota bacterium]
MALHPVPRRSEDGATLVLVAVLAVTVMIMAAFVIDVGALLQERRELQNGADAAALAVAQSCAASTTTGECATDASAALAAAPYADGNALDGAATVDFAMVDRANGTVTVRTSTREPGGSPLVPFSFARVIGLTGETVRAKATARWGPPASATVIPLAISPCELAAAGFGTARRVLFHNTNSKAQTCPLGPNGSDVAGGFGWLDGDPGRGCSVALSAGNEASARTGASVPAACDLAALLGKTVLIPVFDRIVPSGTNALYRIVGFGAFVLDGYRFPGRAGGSPVPCSSPDTCVSGTFTHFVDVSAAGPIGGGDFGVSVVRLVS